MPIQGRTSVGRHTRCNGSTLDSMCSKDICNIEAKLVTQISHTNLSSPIEKNLLKVTIRNNELTSLIDTGASISCVSFNTLDKIFGQFHQTKLKTSKIKAIRGVCGELHEVLGEAILQLNINGLKLLGTFVVCQRLHHSIILGLDFLKEHKTHTDLGSQTVSFHNKAAVTALTHESDWNNSAIMCYSVVLKPRSHTKVHVRAENFLKSEAVLVVPNPSLTKKFGVLGAKCLSHMYGNYTVGVVFNPLTKPVTLKKGTKRGRVEEIDSTFKPSHLDIHSPSNIPKEQAVCAQVDSSTAPSSHFIQIAKDLGINLDTADLTGEEKQILLEFLGRNRKSFATNLSELGSTDVYHHRIETGNAPPIKKRFYSQLKLGKNLKGK